MAENRNAGSEQPPKNEHGQGFKDRPAGEKSRYDPELEMPDPQQVDQDIQESETTYPDRKEPAA